MLDHVGHVTVFAKIYLTTGFHQNQTKSEYIEKTAFNAKYGQLKHLMMPM